MKIGFLTYGCKSNRWETERIRQSLLDAGASESDAGGADTVIINTCTVTGGIDREILRKIKHLKKKLGKKVILTGCLAERGDAWSAELAGYADLVVPNAGKFSASSYNIPGLISCPGPEHTFLKQFSGRDKAFVKVEDGCDNFCAYCEVPYVRGSVIGSRDAEEIKKEIIALSGAGHSEIVLTGINLGFYGRETGDNGALAGLLRELVKIKGNFRLRLSSIGPKETDAGLIDIMARSDGKICPHLHMSLQSGDEKVLRSMNRNYTLKEYKKKMDLAISAMPGMAMTTDVIAGFPGETDEEHKNTCRFILENSFTRLHVFPYSDRPDTKASGMKDKINEETKKQRVKELIAIGKKKEKEYAEKNMGVTRTVMAENGDKGGFVAGYTENYIRVLFKVPEEKLGCLVPVIVEKLAGDRVYAKIVE